MSRVNKTRTALAAMTAALAIGAAAAPGAGAALVAGNLVGVGIDVNNNQILDQNEVVVQVPVGIAANVCDVNANVLAQQRKRGSTRCVSDADSFATVPGPFQPSM